MTSTPKNLERGARKRKTSGTQPPEIPNIERWVFLALLAGNATLIGLWIIGLFAGIKVFPLEIQRLLNPDGEGNYVSWYSNLLLIMVTMVCVANFWLEHATQTITKSAWRFAWLGIASVTLFLSLEETAQIHESVQDLFMRLMEGGGDLAGWVGTQGRAWILPYLPGILAVVAGFLFAFFRLFRHYPRSLILSLAGLGFWSLVLIMEFFFMDIYRQWGEWYFSLEIVLEEASEIIGTSCLLVAFVSFRRARISEIFQDEVKGLL